MTEWTTQQCAEFFGTTRRTIQRWRHIGFPSPIRVDGLIGNFYDSAAVMQWAATVGKYDDFVGVPESRQIRFARRYGLDRLSTSEVSEMLGYAPGSLYALHRTFYRDCPWPEKQGGCYPWSPADVAAAAQWIAARRSRRASV